MVQPLKRDAHAPAHPAGEGAAARPDFAHLLALAGEADAAHQSPARRLQLEIEAKFAEPEPARWPRPARAGFILGASLILWGGLIWGVAALG